MKVLKQNRTEQKAPAIRAAAHKPKLQIVKLAERIAPGRTPNHNETLVRDDTSKTECRK